MATGGSYMAPPPAPVSAGYSAYGGGQENMYNFNESQGFSSGGGGSMSAASLRSQNLSPVMFDASAASYTMQVGSSWLYNPIN